jgi:uncharacterized protein YdeI (YjbR/CyaY-like superfamily)
VAARTCTVELERVGKTATMFRVPFDLEEAFGRAREALEADGAAKAAFAKLSFTHRREYVEWVGGAKRPETRTRLVAAAVERARRADPIR